MAAIDSKVPPLPIGLGSAIAEAFGIPPSKRLGDLRKEVETRCENGELESHKDVSFYIEWMRAHAGELGL